MCYNKNCKIEIVSRIEGSVNTVQTNGKVIKTASDMRFYYTLDGDECTLTVKDNEAVQERRGEQNIKMIFRKGEKTVCFLESGGYSGSFTVFTHGLRVETGQTDTLSIVYTLGEQKIELNFSAEYKYNAKVKK